MTRYMTNFGYLTLDIVWCSHTANTNNSIIKSIRNFKWQQTRATNALYLLVYINLETRRFVCSDGCWFFAPSRRVNVEISDFMCVMCLCVCVLIVHNLSTRELNRPTRLAGSRPTRRVVIATGCRPPSTISHKSRARSNTKKKKHAAQKVFLSTLLLRLLLLIVRRRAWWCLHSHDDVRVFFVCVFDAKSTRNADYMMRTSALAAPLQKVQASSYTIGFCRRRRTFYSNHVWHAPLLSSPRTTYVSAFITCIFLCLSVCL